MSSVVVVAVAVIIVVGAVVRLCILAAEFFGRVMVSKSTCDVVLLRFVTCLACFHNVESNKTVDRRT